MQSYRNSRILMAAVITASAVSGAAGNAQTPKTDPVTTPAERKAAQNDPVISGKETNADKQFLMMAIQGNMMEVQAAQIAMKQSKNQNLQDYARRIIDEHTIANNQATQIATQKGYTIPTALNSQSKAKLNQLTRTKSNFDRAYFNEQLQDHIKSVAMYKKEAGTGYDDTIKTYAATTLPKLQTHLDEVKTFLNPTRGSITPENTRKSPNSRPNGTNGSGDTNAGAGSGTKSGG